MNNKNDQKLYLRREIKDKKVFKFSFFKRFKESITDPYFGNIAIDEKLGKSIGYYFKLLLILSLILGIVYFFQFSNVVDNIVQVLRNDLPDFQFANGVLTAHTSMPHRIENDDLIIIIDTDDNTRMVDLRPTTTNKPILLVNSGAFEVYSPTDSSYPFGERFELSALANVEEAIYQDTILTKDNLIDFLTESNLMPLIMAMMTVSAFILHKILAPLYLYLFSRILSIIKRLPIRNTEVLSMAFYALTVPNIFHLLTSGLGISFPYINWIYYGIALFFVNRFFNNLEFTIKIDTMQNPDS